MPRRFPIFQFPNPPLIVAGVAAVTSRLVGGRLSPVAGRVSQLALLVWAFEEVVAGANWFRRLLGAGGGGYALSRLRKARSCPSRPRPDLRLSPRGGCAPAGLSKTVGRQREDIAEPGDGAVPSNVGDVQPFRSAISDSISNTTPEASSAVIWAESYWGATSTTS